MALGQFVHRSTVWANKTAKQHRWVAGKGLYAETCTTAGRAHGDLLRHSTAAVADSLVYTAAVPSQQHNALRILLANW